jgi:hypothetical protein
MNTLYKTYYILTRSFWSTAAVTITLFAVMLFLFPPSFFFGTPAIVKYVTLGGGALWFVLYTRLKWVRIIEVRRI